ncbi:MAG: YkgJ family cysteine cluster protein [Chlamydiia bacterium]|nr:YkgJ family cysteine cluster protein [Chlamydiia bacterium]
MTKLPWYKDGLRFKCTGCGGCCTGFPGYVFVSDEEIIKMAEHLKLSVKEFGRLYLRQDASGRLSLKELSKTYDCVFLRDKKRCSIYEVRPKQCRTFPFWPEALSSPEAWEETARYCEGINPQAPKVPLEVIKENLHA